MTQKERVLQYCEDFGSISTLEAFRDLGITRLGARIYDIEQSGRSVKRTTEFGKNRYGETTNWTRYTIEG